MRLAALLLLAGCTNPYTYDGAADLYPDETEAFHERWERTEAPLSARCRSMIDGLRVVELPETEARRRCYEQNAYACVVLGDFAPVAYIAEGEGDAVTHEMKHVGLWCRDGDGDGEHLGTVWGL